MSYELTPREAMRAEALGYPPDLFARHLKNLRRDYAAIGRSSKLRRCSGILEPSWVPGCDLTTTEEPKET
jgi:hypothetical protein